MSLSLKTRILLGAIIGLFTIARIERTGGRSVFTVEPGPAEVAWLNRIAAAVLQAECGSLGLALTVSCSQAARVRVALMC